MAPQDGATRGSPSRSCWNSRSAAASSQRTALPALVIIAGIISTYMLAGLFGIAIAVTTMLALAGSWWRSTPSGR